VKHQQQCIRVVYHRIKYDTHTAGIKGCWHLTNTISCLNMKFMNQAQSLETVENKSIPRLERNMTKS